MRWLLICKTNYLHTVIILVALEPFLYSIKREFDAYFPPDIKLVVQSNSFLQTNCLVGSQIIPKVRDMTDHLPSYLMFNSLSFRNGYQSCQLDSVAIHYCISSKRRMSECELCPMLPLPVKLISFRAMVSLHDFFQAPSFS